MNNQAFLQLVFNGYAFCFHKGLWHTSSNYSDMTTADLNFFITLGQSLGFRVRREMNWDYPRDLCWCQTNGKTSDDDAKTFLYLERENSNNRAVATVQKMLHPQNAPLVPYLVAVFGWVKEQTLDDIKQEIQARLGNHQTFLLISWVAETQNSNHWILHGWCFSDGQSSTRKLDVRIDENGHWYVMTEQGSVWL